MTDARLQAFCERCGTRYTSDAPVQPPPAESGKGRLGRLARRGADKPEEQAPTVSTASPSADAFAGTFHFCMDCRQYVCNKCWNTEGNGCISDRPPNRGGQAVTGEAAMASPFAARNFRSSLSAGSSGTPSGDVDEWGRPRQADGSGTDSTQPVQFDGGEDPWRGVVFSDDERGSDGPAAATSAAPNVEPTPNIDFGAERGAPEPAPAEAWPETDRRQKLTAAPQADASAWPETDRRPVPTTPSEPKPEPEAVDEPEAEPVAEAAPEAEPVVAPEPEAVAEPEPEPVVAPEPETVAEPHPLAAEALPEPGMVEPEMVEPEPRMAEAEPALDEPEAAAAERAEPEPETVAAAADVDAQLGLSLIHISEPTRLWSGSRMPSSA